ncbi:MAG TPA: helix-turn-helix domain-containing protein [Methylomirabilota bacterium]|nr:helix-turn-helix domain-containing protein [Methylomirabilota bacterium]
MSTLEAIPTYSMWASILEAAVSPPFAARAARPVRRPAPDAPAAATRVGLCSLRQIVDAAVSRAESLAIRRALASTAGNKSHAARLLRTNYTTLHAKMKRYRISAREFQPAR